MTDQLSSREREIVQLVAERKTNKEAAALDLSVKNIETRRANVMKKLGCRTVSDLVLCAVRNKIIQV